MDDLEEIRLFVNELYRGLEWLPYHVFLGVDEEARGDALREAFHERAASFHPDRFQAAGDEPLREQVYAVYKRITEAYRVLGDPALRAQYEAQRAEGAVRLDRERSAPRRADEEVSHPQARRWYQMALEAERAGDLKSARMHLQLALSLAPNDAIIRDMIEKLKTS